jgi:hypothetical protein
MDRWNVAKGRSMFMTKWSAGCSMSEATNDLGYMHSILHNLFASPDFKYKQRQDPPGLRYSALKAYLKEHLDSDSFQTFWKCICAMELFMLKAFTPMNVQSALLKGGFEGSIINTHTIMSHNVEFVALDEEEAEHLLQLIDYVLVPYWRDHGIIHEFIFDELFEGEENIDTLNNIRKGKPLNELSTNRQRFMMDNHACWKAELSRRKVMEEAAEAEKERKIQERLLADSLKPKKFRNCDQPGCPNILDISTNTLKKSNEKLWVKCRGKSCRFWFCTDHFATLALHEGLCRKILKNGVEDSDSD